MDDMVDTKSTDSDTMTTDNVRYLKLPQIHYTPIFPPKNQITHQSIPNFFPIITHHFSQLFLEISLKST